MAKSAPPKGIQQQYDPNASYVALKNVAHPEAEAQGGVFFAGAGDVFTMKHRTPKEIAFLVEGAKAIQPMTTATAVAIKEA